MNKDIWICADYDGAKYLRQVNHANCESVQYDIFEAEAEKVKLLAPSFCVVGQLYNINEVFKIEKYKIIKQEFDQLSENGQWNWFVNLEPQFKKQIIIHLDNDSTHITFSDFRITEETGIFYFKSDIGNRAGILHLLKNLGFNVEHV